MKEIISWITLIIGALATLSILIFWASCIHWSVGIFVISLVLVGIGIVLIDD